MPKSKRRKHGRRGSFSPGHANVPILYHRTMRCGGRNLNNATRRRQGGFRQMLYSRRATSGPPPNYSSRDAIELSKDLATTANSQSPERQGQAFRYQMAHYDFPSDEINHVRIDQHSSRHYRCTDAVECPKSQHERPLKPKTNRIGNSIESDAAQFRSKTNLLDVPFSGRMNVVSDTYSNPECGYGEAFCSSENPLTYRVSSGAMKRDEYANSNKHDCHLGFQMDRHDFPISDKRYQDFDHQDRLYCEQDGTNQDITFSVVRANNQNAKLMQKRTDTSDDNFHYWISSILNYLVKNGNRMELEQLQREFEREHTNIEMELEKFPNIFDISENISDTETDDNEEEGILRDKYVSGKTDVRLCEKHCSNAGSCPSEDCDGLHICKFYILNTCRFEQCAYGHDIRDPHNIRVLQMHLLHALSPDNLGHLMRNIRSRNETTMPTICRFYNRMTGCSHNECQFLHLCRYFVKGDCKFGLKCQRSHNYSDQQPSMVLERYGILEVQQIVAVKTFLRNAKSTMENKSNTVITNGMEYSEDYSRLNRFVKYDQGHPGEGKGRRLSKNSIMNVSKLEESVSAEKLDYMSDQTATGDICNKKEGGECDSEHPSPKWIKLCLPVLSSNGKPEGKSLTQFGLDTIEIDTSSDRKVGTVSKGYLKHEYVDQTDPSQHLEKPCFSGSLLTTTTTKQDSTNNGSYGTECIQAVSPTVIKNSYTGIPVDNVVLSRSEQTLSVTISQNQATSNHPVLSYNEKPKGKDLTQFCAETTEMNNAGDPEVGIVSKGYLKHECMDQTDPSQHLEKPCFSDSLLTTLNNKQDSFTKDYSGKECVQDMNPTVIDNCYAGIAVDDESLGRSEQRLAVPTTQKHANLSHPDDARKLELKRVISKDGMPTWIYRYIDNMTSLPLEPGTCDHLEKRYQEFQRARKCSIEILGLKLDVDLLTVEGQPLLLPTHVTHESP